MFLGLGLKLTKPRSAGAPPSGPVHRSRAASFNAVSQVRRSLTASFDVVGDSGLLQVMPAILAAGTKAELGSTGSQNTNLAPALPLSFPGCKLILHVIIAASPTVSCATPAGWELVANDMLSGNGAGHWIFAADHGAAAPSVDWNAPDGANTRALARILSIVNVKPGTPWHTLGNTAQALTSGTVTIASLTTTLVQCLGLAFNSITDDPVMIDATGETGGDWTEIIEEVTTTLGNDAAIQVQSALLPTPTTISGGTFAITPSTNWISRTLGVHPLEDVRGEIVYTVNTAPRPQVLYDLDIDSDIDDVADLVFMLNLEHLGELDIRAAVVTSAQVRAAPTMKAITNYYGRTGLVIGANTNSQGAFASLYNDQTQAAHPVPGFATAADFPAALTVLRQTLAGAADNSIEYLTTGSLDSVKLLLDSPGDGISPLTGVQLVAQKVRNFWCVAGVWPQGAASSDFGATSARAAISNAVLAAWPSTVPIIFNNLTESGLVVTGANVMVALNAANPARTAWVTFFGNITASNSRSGWAQYSMLGLARGVWPNSITGTNYLRMLGRSGKGSVHATTGVTNWDFGTAGNHGYLRRTTTLPTFVTAINTKLLDPSVW